jgi:hypothetical protein
MTLTPRTQGAGFLLAAIVISLLTFAIPATTIGQETESFEGFVSGIRANAVKGDVFYQRADGKFPVEPGLHLQESDFIKTGENSYAELLLQPGNYLRIGGESDFQIFTDAYDRMRLKLNQGAINLEILAKEGEDSTHFAESLDQGYELIRIITPNAEVFITRPGIFRINVWSNERTELLVRDGEAVINGRRIKEKKSATAYRAEVTIADSNHKTGDGFDAWSRERAEELVNANRVLKKEAPWANKRKEGEETVVDLPKDETQGSKSRYVVSARPGAVNFVEAGVEFNRATKDWKAVTEDSKLESGDRLRTSSYSYVELTMLPDINLRIDGGSEILLEQMSYDSILLKLVRGSAILDVVRFDRKEVPKIALAGTSTSVTIADKGNYRIDVTPNSDEITVRDGKVIFQERSVGSCRKITGGVVLECHKKRSDNFDYWSEHRGEGEFYNGQDMVAMVAHLAGLRRTRFRNKGFWYQHPGKTSYTFVPFSSPYFRSPYGGSYSTVLSPRRLPVIRLNRDGGPHRFPRPGLRRP